MEVCVIIITRHAEEKIKVRTKLSPKDVKKQLEAGAFISLYRDEAHLYQLFFSYPDQDWFVAVIVDGYALKTVLRLNYVMPCAVKHKHKKAARKKYQQYIFQQRVQIPTEKPVEGRLEVYVKKKREFVHEFGPVLWSQYPDHRALANNHRVLFETVVPAVEAWLQTVEGVSVRYKFYIKGGPKNEFQKKFEITHKKLKSYLEQFPQTD